MARAPQNKRSNQNSKTESDSSKTAEPNGYTSNLLRTARRGCAWFKRHATKDNINVASTALVALATIAIFGVTWAQWAVLSGQLDEMRASAEQTAKLIEANSQLAAAATEQAQASQRAATAAESSVNIAREAQIASQRAWVGPYQASLDQDPREGKPTKAIIKFKNTGREPAQDFWTSTDIFVASGADDANGSLTNKLRFAIAFCFSNQPKAEAQVIYPQSDGLAGGYELKAPIDEKLLPIVAGHNMLIISGCITYRTSGSARHSAFCYFYRPLSTDRADLNICTAGNRAD